MAKAPTSSLDLQPLALPLTSGRYLSNSSALCFSRYCPRAPFATLIHLLLFITVPCRHSSPSAQSRDTVVTEPGRVVYEARGARETKLMIAVSFIRCISTEHEISGLYASVQCHFRRLASAQEAFLISLGFLVHERLMCSTKKV